MSHLFHFQESFWYFSIRSLVIGFVKNVDRWREGIDSRWEGKGWYKSLAADFSYFWGGEIFLELFLRNVFLFASCIVERRDRICRKGRIGDTSQKEGNSEFSFLAKFLKGEFFTSAVTRRVAMLLPCFLRYPGMLQGYVLLLGNFPSMPIPID